MRHCFWRPETALQSTSLEACANSAHCPPTAEKTVFSSRLFFFAGPYNRTLHPACHGQHTAVLEQSIQGREPRKRSFFRLEHKLCITSLSRACSQLRLQCDTSICRHAPAFPSRHPWHRICHAIFARPFPSFPLKISEACALHGVNTNPCRRPARACPIRCSGHKKSIAVCDAFLHKYCE